jgi:serine/threonine-protein kinase HipA
VIPIRSTEVYLNTDFIGILSLYKGNKLGFEYDSAYAGNPQSIPLSYSMPLTKRTHEDQIVRNFLWGLFPDNERVIREWARELQVTATHPFDLAVGIGHDFAGAVYFGNPSETESTLQHLSQRKLVELINELVRNPARGRFDFTQGRFSLAGAQAKTALRKVDKKWYLPIGLEPTTHILKPMLDTHPNDYAYNEHYCQSLARRIGLHVAQSQVEKIGEHTVLISTRYDRFPLPDGKLIRLHQEDTCQALGVHPSEKYEADGGPGIPSIMQLMLSAKDGQMARKRFMDSILFNFLIMGTDAHAKNYSLIYGRGGEFTLAPLYDLSSYLPHITQRKDPRLAMRIGKDYKDQSILKSNFVKLCKECKYPEEQLFSQAKLLMEAIQDEAPQLKAELSQQKLWNETLDKLSERLLQRVERAANLFAS